MDVDFEDNRAIGIKIKRSEDFEKKLLFKSKDKIEWLQKKEPHHLKKIKEAQKRIQKEILKTLSDKSTDLSLDNDSPQPSDKPTKTQLSVSHTKKKLDKILNVSKQKKVKAQKEALKKEIDTALKKHTRKKDQAALSDYQAQKSGYTYPGKSNEDSLSDNTSYPAVREEFLSRKVSYSINLFGFSTQSSFPYESISDEEFENVSETEKQLALERQQAEFTAELARLEKSFQKEFSEEEDFVENEKERFWQKTKTILKNLQTTGILLKDLKDKLSILKFSVDQLNSNAFELEKLKENSDIFQRLVAQINTEQFKMNALTWQLNEAIEQLNHQYDLIDLKFPDLIETFSGLAIEGEDSEEDMLYAEPEYNIEQALADYRKLKPELMGHYIAPKDELESQPEMEPEDPAQALKTQRTIDFNKKAQNHERDQAKLLRGKGLNYAFDRFKNRGIAEDAAVAQVATHFAKLENKPANSTKTEGINPEKNSSSKTGMMHGFDLHRRSATTPSSLKNKNGLDSNKAKYAHCSNSNQPHGNIERSQMREIPTFKRNRFGYPE